MAAGPLAGRLFWLTRPEGQNAPVQAALEAQGAQVLCVPLLRIEALPPTPQMRETIQQLDRYSLLFYVSANAVKIGLDRIFDWWPQYPEGITNFAVGSGTAAVLQARGLGVYYPSERMTSEALLELPQLQHVAGKRALIVRGVGGREVMARSLRERGCQVDYLELYRRMLPPHPPEHLASMLSDTFPDAVVLSSADAMDNLVTLFAPLGDQWRTLPLVVASERLRQHALLLGFAEVRCLENASDAAIIAGLCDSFGQEPSHV